MKFAKLPFTEQINNYVWNHQAYLGAGTQAEVQFYIQNQFKVYLGHDTNKGSDQSEDNLVAIKIMHNYQLQNQLNKKLLENEIEILTKLKSCGDNVLSLYDCKKDTENIYIIQMFCNKGDFRSILTKETKLSETISKQILKQIVEGYKNLKQIKVVHRDLKPENILIHNNFYKISDFGVSAIIQDFDKEVLQESCGTPLYSSPQILKGEDYSSKSDVWSLGVIYYEMLVGTTPWNCNSLFELVGLINQQTVKFPVNLEISDESQDFICKCLQIDEANRLSWDQVFDHPLLNKKINELQYSFKIDFTKELKEIVKKIQEIIENNKYQEDNFFKQFYQEGRQIFNKEQFHKMILELDKTIPKEQIDDLFQILDINFDGQLSFQQFYRQIIQTDYNEDNKNVLLDEMRANQLIKKLIDKIYQNDLSIQQIIKQYDISNNQALQFTEFQKLLLEIDSTILQNEAQYIFTLFDKNSDKSITLQEFQTKIEECIQKLGGDPDYKKEYPEPQIKMEEKPLQLLKKLRKIVYLNKLNIQQIMKNHDIDHSNKLELQEFSNFVLIFDQSFKSEDIKVLFDELDKDKSGSIDCTELKLAFDMEEQKNIKEEEIKVDQKQKDEKKEEQKPIKQEIISEEKPEEIKQEIIEEQKSEEIIQEQKPEEIKQEIKPKESNQNQNKSSINQQSLVQKQFQFPVKIEPIKKIYDVNPSNLDDPVGYLQGQISSFLIQNNSSKKLRVIFTKKIKLYQSKDLSLILKNLGYKKKINNQINYSLNFLICFFFY